MANQQTSTFAVDNTGYVAIKCRGSFARRILIQEDYDSSTPPTQDYVVQQPAGAPDIKVAKGTPFIFTYPLPLAGFVNDGGVTVLGQVKTAAGAITMQQIESPEI